MKYVMMTWKNMIYVGSVNQGNKANRIGDHKQFK
jgi:hypothetical protein